MHDTSQLPAACHVCNSPTGDEGSLCRLHTDELAVELAAVPGLVRDLEVTTTRQDRTTATNHGSRSTTSPLAFNQHAAEASVDLNLALNAWALDTAKIGEDERDPLRPIHHTDTTNLARWLTRNINTLRRNPDAGQAHHELTATIRAARRSVDKPPDLHVYGPCRYTGPDDDRAPCPAYLYAPPGQTFVQCPLCRAQHDTATRKAWMLDYARDMLGTATEIATYLRLCSITTTPSAVRGMANRDRFPAVGTDVDGRPLYRIADVLTAIGERYTRRGPVAA